MIPRISLRPGDQSEFCRVTLSLGSTIKLTSLFGFGYGIVSVIVAFFLALLGVEKYAGISAPMTLLVCVLGPIIGALHGMMLGLLGYPLYKFLMNRRDGQTLRGSFTTLQTGLMDFRRDNIPNQVIRPTRGPEHPIEGQG